MYHLKFARAVPGVSFLLDPEQTAFELAHVAAQRAPDASASPKPKRNTKLKGDISEVMVLAALIRAGYNVSIPFGENQRYDIVADDGTRLLRIQVKSGRIRGGVIVYSCCSSHGHRDTKLRYRPYFGQIELPRRVLRIMGRSIWSRRPNSWRPMRTCGLRRPGTIW